MRRIKNHIGLLAALLITLGGNAQELLDNTIVLATKQGDTVSSFISSKAALFLKDGTQDFKAAIELFPIVPDPDAEDSLAQQLKPLILRLEGRFPVSDIDFLGTADNGKIYSMNVIARLNDSVRNTVLRFSLPTLHNPANDPNSNFSNYQSRISFILMIDPKDFGLDLEPFDIKNIILIQAAAAIISKQEEVSL